MLEQMGSTLALSNEIICIFVGQGAAKLPDVFGGLKNDILI